MTWLLIRKFWPAAVISILIVTIWAFALRLDNMTIDRDGWKKEAAASDVRAGSWEASFRQAETMRQEAQQGSVQAMNASAASCAERVEKARSSAAQIERIVNVPTKCAPGDSVARVISDPRSVCLALTPGPKAC